MVAGDFFPGDLKTRLKVSAAAANEQLVNTTRDPVERLGPRERAFLRRGRERFADWRGRALGLTHCNYDQRGRAPRPGTLVLHAGHTARPHPPPVRLRRTGSRGGLMENKEARGGVWHEAYQPPRAWRVWLARRLTRADRENGLGSSMARPDDP